MDDDFLQGLLALYPEAYDRYARAATHVAQRDGADMDVRASAAVVLPGEEDTDPDRLLATEGAYFARPVTINGVAILPLYGFLAPSLPWWLRGTSTEAFAMRLLSALDDPDVREIVVRINSPGGALSGTAELADLIYRSRDRKPITGIGVNGQICSAAYFVGAACGRLYATRTTDVGSLGVIWGHYDLTKLNERQGVRVSLLSIPDDKAIGYEDRPLSDADRKKLIDTWLGPAYELFVTSVARYRGVSVDKVKAEYGGGLTYSADEAARRGMIDGVQDWHSLLGSLGVQTLTPIAGGATHTPHYTSGVGAHTMTFSARLRAVMLTAGILESLDVEDAACAMALRVWCTARGEPVPADEEGAEALIRQSLAGPTQPAASTPQPAVNSPATPPQQIDVQAVVAQALADEHGRQAAIRDRAALLGTQLGIEIPESDLNAALGDAAMTAARFSEQVLARAAQQQQPVTRIQGGQAALDRFTQTAASAILMRAGPELARMAVSSGADPTKASQELQQLAATHQAAVREVAGMSWLQIARESVRLAGQRPRDNSDEAWATAFLKLAGEEHQRFAFGHPGIEGGLLGSAPIHGPGDFPNLMGLVAQSTSLFAINVAPVSYWRWATRHDDALNFNPQEILQFYGSTRLDEHVDTLPPGQATFREQPAWIAVHQYSKGAKLSSRMIIQNQLATFLRMLVQFQIAIERTVNELVVNHLLTNTPSPFDGKPLFHDDHANDRASGNPPSIEESKAMRLLLAKQTIPGDPLEAGLTFDFALYGADHINAAEVQYLPAYKIVPAEQSHVNQFTGRVEPIYEPMLSQGGAVWYAGSRSPMLAGIIYSFLSGSGPGGRRVTYFDPATQCQSFDYYVEAGSALVNYQLYARNSGSGAGGGGAE